ncbi:MULTISPECIES: DUF4114 domain-containing protein [unclassified Microcoleus]|uniref:DUF4114 domain-containing protein n=1 Tax=unclassified Microcoleus TaxID=2642155 RepID=UPI002FD3BBF1
MTERNIGALTGSTSYTGSVNTTNIFDLYKFNITSPGSFQFSIDGLSGNADIFLLNSSGETLYSSTNAGTEAETIIVDSLLAGDYSLKVKVSQISGDIKYTLNSVPTSTQKSSDADTLTGAKSDSALPSNSAETSEKPTANKDVITGTPVDDKTVTAETTLTTTDEPDKPVTDSEPTLTSEPEKPVVTTESAVETTTTDKPLPVTSETTLTSEPKKPISTTDSAAETKSADKPVTTGSETTLTSEPKKPISTTESASEELPTSEETLSAGEIAQDKPTDSAISTAEKPSETVATNNPNSTVAVKTGVVAGETVATQQPKTGETLVATSPDASKPEDKTNTDTSNGEETKKENSNTTVATTETKKEPEPITEKKLISLFTSGVFTTDQTGRISIDYTFDGGRFQGELAIFSLDDLDNLQPGSEAFIKEVAARSLSNSVKGHVVINDATEGARFSGLLGEDNANEGVYLGVKSFAVTPGGKYGVMLVPNGSVKSVFDNPTVGGDQRPLFSMAMANPVEGFHFGQMADLTGEGNTFIMEDMRLDAGSDKDYNDIIFQVRGATAKAALLDTVINPGKEWRKTDLGKALIAYATPYITQEPKQNVDAELSDLIDDLETEIVTPSTSDKESPKIPVPATNTDKNTSDAAPIETTDTVEAKPTTPGVTTEEKVKNIANNSGDLTPVETTEKVETKPTNLEVATEEKVKDTENNPGDLTQVETTDQVEAKPTTPAVTTEEEVKDSGDLTQVKTTDQVEAKPTTGETATPTAGKDTLADSTEKLPVEKTPLPVATTEIKDEVIEAPATPVLPAQSNAETEVAATTPTQKLETQPENLPAGSQSKVETKPEVLPAVIPVKEEAKPGVVTEVEKTEPTKVFVVANPVECVKESQPKTAVESKETAEDKQPSLPLKETDKAETSTVSLPESSVDSTVKKSQPTLTVESKETLGVVPPLAAPTMPVVGTNTAVESQKKEIVTQTETGGINDAAPKESLPVSPTVEKPTEDNSTVTVTESVKNEVAQNNNVNADWIARLESIKQRLSNLGSADVVAEKAIDRTLIARLEAMTEKLREQTGSTPISDNTATLISRLEDMVVKVAPPAIAPVQFEFPQADRPLVGFITDTGLTVNNPAEEKSPLVAEEKPANSTNNPSPSANGVNNNPSQPVARTQDNSSQWVESLIKFVDAAKVSKQPHAVVNININLTQTQPDGTVIPRSELTAAERSAIAYAYQNKVIVVVPAGDNPGIMSALGLLSKEVDNVVTVGAAQRFNNSVALSNAFKLADYSGSGNTLDILANGSSGSTSSTQVAAVEVTNGLAQVLAANPKLNYTQAIDAIKRTSTDLDRPNWDAKTGSGLLNVAAAVHLAKVTTPALYTVKPGQRTITDVFISQHPSTKQLPGDPTHPTVKVPGIPQTNVDRGSNNLANATQLIPSATEDIIDQVSSVDPSDIYRVDSRYLNGAKFSVLSGDLSVSYLTTSGQLLATQSLSKGSHKLQLPTNAPAEVIVKIDQRNAEPATYVLSGFESTATEPFNIDLEYETPLSASQQAIMQAAAKSVAGLIGKGLPSAVVDGKIIDDINIKISTANIDGASGTQARTKIDFMRYGTMLPAQSLVQFDAADIAELERSGKLFSVVQHEFLHALGFGNLWEAKGLVDYAGTPLAQYNGGKAVDAFKDLGGLTDAISLENEGKGSAGFHWNEALFQDEVMTADLNFSGKGGNAPISPVTIASLADLGYEVNLKGATPDFGLFGGQGFSIDDLTPEQLEAFRELAETSFEEPGAEYIAPIMPTVDPDKVSPEIWAHAERFWKNGEYYDWVDYVIPGGDTLSDIALKYLGSAGYDYYAWIGDYNGVANYDEIGAGDWIKVPIHHPNYEWEQQQEWLRREEELRQRQEEEARIRREQEEAFARDQERVRQEEEARRREAEAQQRELEEQQRRLREQIERRRQEEQRLKEEARLAELQRQAEIARQQGKGGLDWYLAKPMPEFGPVDPFETSLTGETVGNLVPDDYYRFTLSRGGRITAELRKLLADADLVLYDVRNEPIAYSMREGITDEQIIADLIPGTYMLRVNSPKGVTTDYELIVKFQHKLSLTQTGFPDGWRLGGGNGTGGGSGASGPLFSDSRIQRIYDTALANFSVPERAKANAKIAELEREKRRYEQQMQELLDQMNAEQRQKVHQALDDARHNANVWVDGIANPIKGQVDNLADGIINKANSFANSLENTVNQVPDYGIGWVKDRKNDAKWLIRQGRDAVTSAVNSARSWLRGKLIEIQNGVNSAIQQFFDTIKNAYRTGAEINQIIANAAQTFRTKVDQAVRGANNLIGEFKGHILSATDWTKNLGINVDKFGVKFNFNVYNNIVKPAVDGVADGFQSTISGIGSGLKGIIDWIEPRTQKTVADIVNAILGDKTGHLWNQINGVDAKIAATLTGVDKAIASAAQRIFSIVGQIEALLTDPEERKRVLNALFRRGYRTAEEAYNFVKEELPKIREQIKEEIRTRLVNDYVFSWKTEIPLVSLPPVFPIYAGAVVYFIQPTKFTHEALLKIGPHQGLELVNGNTINLAAEKKLSNGGVQGLEIDSDGNFVFSLGGELLKLKSSFNIQGSEVTMAVATNKEISIIDDPGTKVSLSGEHSLQLAGKVGSFRLEPVLVLTEEAVKVALKKLQETNSAFREWSDSVIDTLAETFSNPDFWIGVGIRVASVAAIVGAILAAPAIAAAIAALLGTATVAGAAVTLVFAILFALDVLQLQEGNSDVIA